MTRIISIAPSLLVAILLLASGALLLNYSFKCVGFFYVTLPFLSLIPAVLGGLLLLSVFGFFPHWIIYTDLSGFVQMPP
jgi:uncharacterized membrane protein YeaQ/YmgE (transglycosylase-associated protein family)